MQESSLDPSPSGRYDRIFLLLILLAAFALRVATLGGQSLWRDEVDAVYFALRPLRETLSMFTAMAQNGPLYFLSLRPWLTVAGSGEFALRYPSAMAGVVALPLLWQVTRSLLGRRHAATALLATLFLATNPYALWYAQEGKMYAVVLALTLAATWCWLRAIERGGWAWVVYVALTSLALYTHLLTVLVIPLHMIWFAIAWPVARRRWKGYALALAALTLPWLPMLLWQWDMLMAPDVVTGFRAAPLVEMARTYYLNQARGFFFADSLWAAAPVFIVAAVGLVLGVTEIHQDADARGVTALPAWRTLLLVVSWTLAPLLLIWLISLRQPVYTDRYLIWALPATMILLALGVRVIGHALGRAGPAAATVACAGVIGVWLVAAWNQTASPIKYDLRAAVRYVAERRSPDDLLLLQIPHLEFAWRYYTGDRSGGDPFAGSDERLGLWAGGLWTNYGGDDAAVSAEVDRQMQMLTQGRTDLWLVLSEPEMWDQRRLMDKWLEEHGRVVDAADFRGAQVRHFEMGGG